MMLLYIMPCLQYTTGRKFVGLSTYLVEKTRENLKSLSSLSSFVPMHACMQVSVSNTGNTETGFPVFGTLNTDTGKILAVLPVLERIKWALLTKITTF
jgi:hypothetical protein